MITICCRWQRFQARGNSQVEGRRERGEREREGESLRYGSLALYLWYSLPRSLWLFLVVCLSLSLSLSLSPMICLSRPVCLTLYFDLCVFDFVCQRVHPSLGLCFCFCLLPLLRAQLRSTSGARSKRRRQATSMPAPTSGARPGSAVQLAFGYVSSETVPNLVVDVTSVILFALSCSRSLLLCSPVLASRPPRKQATHCAEPLRQRWFCGCRVLPGFEAGSLLLPPHCDIEAGSGMTRSFDNLLGV